jgi:quinol monooxygenase YgiN
MISFTVRMTFRAEDRAEIHQFLTELTRLSRREEGCVSYVAHAVEGDPDTIVIYEQYRDEAAVEAHRTSPHFALYAIGGLYQKMLERSVENLTAIA